MCFDWPPERRQLNVSHLSPLFSFVVDVFHIGATTLYLIGGSQPVSWQPEKHALRVSGALWRSVSRAPSISQLADVRQHARGLAEPIVRGS